MCQSNFGQWSEIYHPKRLAAKLRNVQNTAILHEGDLRKRVGLVTLRA